jgi:hypothetical protein
MREVVCRRNASNSLGFKPIEIFTVFSEHDERLINDEIPVSNQAWQFPWTPSEVREGRMSGLRNVSQSWGMVTMMLRDERLDLTWVTGRGALKFWAGIRVNAADLRLIEWRIIVCAIE